MQAERSLKNAGRHSPETHSAAHFPSIARSGERGAALLTVLIVVAVIGALAALALDRLNLSVRLAGNARSMDQARAYAHAAEAIGVNRINQLLRQAAVTGGAPVPGSGSGAGSAQPGEPRLTLAGGWSNRPFTVTLPGGGIATIRITDGGNCFNLNGVVTETTPSASGFAGAGPAVAPSARTFTVNPTGVTQFAQLMTVLGVSDDEARAIAGATADWIDTDSDTGELGAEDSSYAGGAEPYRTANTLMTDVSELRVVRGVGQPLYDRLKPWLCAMPLAEPAKLNINTLEPEQAPLIAGLFPGTLGVEQARVMLLRRPPGGFPATSEFWKGGPAPGQGDPTVLTSRWFRLRIDVTYGPIRLTETAIVDGSPGKTPAGKVLPPRLATRSWGSDA